MTLTREQIHAATDLDREEVQVPEWGGSVFVRGISGVERDRYDQSLLEGKGKNRQLNLANARAKLVILAACDADGNPIFQSGDLEWLGSKSGKALDRVFSVAQRLSGMTDEDLEDMVKN